VAGKLSAYVDSTFSIAPKHNTPRAAHQSGVAVTIAHHRLQFSTLLDRQLRSLHDTLTGDQASDFNDSVD
ncbi:hypothetical protein, partial [Xanthomonas nasturtii]|uniref:hypothetical protein n=1 Tax=Xanthomonas nasturtii TaxID=1843581 RepID=UPI00201239E5